VLTLKDEYIYQTLGISPWVLNIFFGYHRLRCLAASDCTQATESLPRWAIQNGHSVIEFKQTGDAKWQIRLRKAN
jgi:hypothetical protein